MCAKFDESEQKQSKRRRNRNLIRSMTLFDARQRTNRSNAARRSESATFWFILMLVFGRINKTQFESCTSWRDGKTGTARAKTAAS